MIDAGHGIDTPGKRSPDGSFLEYLWNRQIADLVIARLVSRGVDASLVVTETNDISLRTRAMRVYDAFSRAFPERRMRRDLTDGDSDYEENFYILAKTKCRAVLLENFFYDNREECAWLQLRTTKERIADAIVQGLFIYLSEL